jgi:hypothetical protein
MGDQIKSIAIGDQASRIGLLLGEPLTSTESAGLVVHSYTSQAPSYANYVYFSQGQVVFISQSHYQSRTYLSEYIGALGLPETSILRASAEAKDSLLLVVHIWPQKGKAVTAIGADKHGQVVREDTFSPTTLDQYMDRFGQQLKGHETGTLTDLTTKDESGGLGDPVVMGVILCILAVGVIIFTFWIKRRRKQPVHY